MNDELLAELDALERDIEQLEQYQPTSPQLPSFVLPLLSGFLFLMIGFIALTQNGLWWLLISAITLLLSLFIIERIYKNLMQKDNMHKLILLGYLLLLVVGAVLFLQQGNEYVTYLLVAMTVVYALILLVFIALAGGFLATKKRMKFFVPAYLFVLGLLCLLAAYLFTSNFFIILSKLVIILLLFQVRTLYVHLQKKEEKKKEKNWLQKKKEKETQ